ncbi:hypothetical protein [Streptomyces sp. NPDC056669]
MRTIASLSVSIGVALCLPPRDGVMGARPDVAEGKTSPAYEDCR